MSKLMPSKEHHSEDRISITIGRDAVGHRGARLGFRACRESGVGFNERETMR